nr:RNA-directed DNA polymerase, eukaryota [Tanacetum cinerariifolium]
MASKITAQDLEISTLKARIKHLEDKDGGDDDLSRKDATIKGRRLEIGEEAGIERSTEKDSNDTEEMANILTSLDASSVLTSRVQNLPPTQEEKEKMVESDTPKKKKLQEQIDIQVVREMEEQMEYEQAVAELTIGEKIELINELVKYQDHLASSKEEGERFKRKGINLEQESAKKVKTSEEVLEEDLKIMMQLVPVEEHFDKEDLNQLWALVNETLNIRQSASDKEKELWGNLQHALKDKGVIDSGCSRHMTWNMSYLFDFEKINGGYVAFGENPKGGKITDDTITDYSRHLPAIESNSDELQNRNSSVTKTGESSSTILSKPTIKRTSKSSNVRGNQRNWNNLKSQQLGKNFVMKNKACFNCGNFDHLSYDCGKWVEKGKSRPRNNYKSRSPRTVFHKNDRTPTAINRPHMNAAQPKRTSFYKSSHSYVSRPFQGRSAARTQPRVPTVNKRFPTVDSKSSTATRRVKEVEYCSDDESLNGEEVPQCDDNIIPNVESDSDIDAVSDTCFGESGGNLDGDIAVEQLVKDGYISHLISRWDGECIVMGDFNEVRYKEEHIGSVLNVREASLFNDFIANSSLIDVRLEGYSFTWSHPSASKMSRLDRFLFITCTWNSISLDDRNGMVRFKKKLQLLKKEIKKWVSNRKHQNLGRINEIKANLIDIDRKLDQGGGNDDILLSRVNLMKQLPEFKASNTCEFMQKAKVQWAIEGDKNSKFFHGILNKKRATLSIQGVMVDGDWVVDPIRVKEVFRSHFTSRFNDPGDTHCKINCSFPNCLSSNQVSEMECQVSNDDIRQAVWGCGDDKSPGPDGFSSFSRGCNSSFVSLIPKISDPKFVSDYRPISLIGCLYKAVNKILATRLSVVISGLISDVQTAFVPNRQILDGPFIVNELLDWCKRYKHQAMVFKVDFAKAFVGII